MEQAGGTAPFPVGLCSGGYCHQPSGALSQCLPQHRAGQRLEAQVVQGDPKVCQLCLERLQHVIVCLQNKGRRSCLHPTSRSHHPRTPAALSLTLQTRASWSCRSLMVAFLELSTSCKGTRHVRQPLPSPGGTVVVPCSAAPLPPAWRSCTVAWLQRSSWQHGLDSSHTPPVPFSQQCWGQPPPGTGQRQGPPGPTPQGPATTVSPTAKAGDGSTCSTSTTLPRRHWGN